MVKEHNLKDEQKSKPAEKEPLSDAQIIRRQILIVFSILAGLGVLYGAWLWGEDTGWGNADRAVKMKLDKANDAFVHQDLDGAIAIYVRLIDRYPKNPMITQALTQLGTAYQAKGDLTGAMATYQKLLGEVGDDKADLKAYTMLQVGQLQLQENDYGAAIAEFEQVRSYRPGSDWAGEALSQTGKAWENQKEYGKAVQAYQELIKEMPGGFLAAEAQSSIGECYESQGKFKQAIAAYKVVLDKYPSAVWDQAQARIDALKKRIDKKSS